MPMVQAYAEEVLNQKDAQNGASDRVYQSDELFSATERLLNALDRLENGLEQSLSRPVHQPESVVIEDTESKEKLAFFEQENTNLRKERENLNQSISQLREQYGELHQAASSIYNKLDDSIRRLTQIMKD